MDIIIDDAPDAITTQVEDFQVLGEMNEIRLPDAAGILVLASPLSNRTGFSR